MRANKISRASVATPSPLQPISALSMSSQQQVLPNRHDSGDSSIAVEPEDFLFTKEIIGLFPDDYDMNVPPLCLPDGMLEAGKAKIEALAQDMKLQCDAIPLVIRAMVPGETRGNDTTSQATIDRYASLWRSALSFCILSGRYEDAIILHRDKCPKYPTPVCPETAILIMAYFCLPPTQTLQHPRTGEDILDVFGKPIACVGTWKCPNTVRFWQAALHTLHSHYATTKGHYQDSCEDCRKFSKEEVTRGKSCVRHAGKSRYYREGDVSNDPFFQDKVSMYADYLKQHYHGTSTRYAFSPKEVRQLRTHYLSQDDLPSLLFWTIIVVGIRYFLSIDEVLSIKVEDFLTDFTMVKGKTGVEGLCLQVKGRPDMTWNHFLLWQDPDYPEFDPIVAVLAWIYLT